MKKNWTKRFMSLLLAGVMTMSSVCVGYAADVEPGYSATVTDGYIVAESYDVLSEAEKDIMKNVGVTGESITYTAPSDTGLVTVDPVAKTVTAATYTDAQQNEWKAVEAYVAEDGSDTKIDSFVNGAGSYTGINRTENYSIKVKYELTKTISEGEQDRLVNTPYYLVTAVEDFEQMADNQGKFKELTRVNSIYQATGFGETVIQMLKALVDGMSVSFTNGATLTMRIEAKYTETIDAINALYAETNGGAGDIELLSYVQDYSANYRDGRKVEYVLGAQGAEAAAKAAATDALLTAIANSEGIKGIITTLENLENMGMASTVALGLDGILTVAKEAAEAIDPTIVEDVVATEGMMSDIADPTMTSLVDAAIASGVVLEGHSLEYTPELSVASTTLISNVNRHDVTVTVKALVIDDATINSNKTTELSSTAVTLQINDQLSYDDLMAAIAEEGIETTALANWNQYDVNGTNYIRTTTELSNVTEDTEFVITYEPTEFTLTVLESTGAEVSTDTVKYGYNMQLAAAGEGKTYDYAVGDSGYVYQEGDIIDIKADTTVQRRLGKEKESERLFDILVADYADSLTVDEKAILLNKAVKSDNLLVAVPSNEDGLVSMTQEGTNYILSADTYPTGITGMDWTPVSYTIVKSTGTEVKPIAENTFSMEDVESVEVNYELKITQRDNSDTEGISNEDVIDFLNIPYTLVAEAKVQKDNMAKLAGQYANLGRGSEIKIFLNSLSGDEDTLADTKARVKILKDNCFVDGADDLKLYGWIGNYKTNGLAAYYTAAEGDYADIAQQVELLKVHLPEILEDPVCIRLAEKNEQISGALDKLDQIMATLNALTFPAPNQELMNLDSAAFGDLAQILDGTPSVREYSTADGITKATVLTKAAEGKVTYTFTVKGYDASGVAVEKSFNKTYNVGYTLNEEDSDAILTEVNALIALVDTVHYDASVEIDVPQAGHVVGSVAQSFTAVYDVLKTFSVVLPDADGDIILADDITYTNRTIELPAAPNGFKYVYTIKIAGTSYDETREVLSTAASVIIPQDMFDRAFIDNGLTITREKINVSVEDTSSFVDVLNSNLDAKGSGADALLLEKDGAMALVLRTSLADLNESFIMGFAESVIGESYIAFNGDTFWTTNGDNAGITVQAFVDGIIDSGFGMSTIVDVIDEAGQVDHLVLDGYTIINGYTGALGGELIKMDMTLGNTEIPFYITLAQSNAKTMKGLEADITKIQNMVDVYTADSVVNVEVDDTSATEKGIEALLAAFLVLEYNSFEDVTEVDFAEFVEWVLTEHVEPLTADPNFSYNTLQNTVASVSDKSLASYKSMINAALRALEYTTMTVAEGTSAYECDMNVSFDIQALLADMVASGKLDELYADQITDTAIVVDVHLVSEDLRDNEYQAMILDNSKAGMAKYNCTKNTAETLAAIAGAGNNAVVILLGDITGDVVVNSGIFMNLNGKTIDGSITNKSIEPAFITDSVFMADGKVTGELTGMFNVAGGTFDKGVAENQLVGGYVVENGAVVNTVYAITEDAAGNLTVELDAAFVEKATDVEIKNTALDVAMQLAFNYYTSASFNIAGNQIYAVDIADAAEFVQTPDIINAVIDMVDLEAVRTFANQLIADFTAFQAMADAVTAGEAIVVYNIATNGWDVTTAVEGAGADSIINVGVTNTADKAKSFTLSVVIGGEAEDKEDLAAVLTELDKVVTINEAQIDELTNIDYAGGKNVIVEGHAVADVYVDLSQDSRYATILGVVLAYSDADMVEVVNNFINNDDTYGFQTALEAMKVSEIISALKKAANVDFVDMLAGITFEDAAVQEEVTALEDIYHVYLNVLYKALNKLGITGGNGTLPKVDGEYGTYGTSKTNWHKTDLTLAVKLFLETPVIIPGIKDSALGTSYYGYHIDETEGYIFVDLYENYAFFEEAMTAEDFWATTDFEVLNGDYKTHFFEGLVDGNIATGTKITVIGENASTLEIAEATFTIIVMGDLNCNGYIEVADAALHRQYQVFMVDFDELQLLAADMNCNGVSDEVADVVAIERRLVDLPVDPVNGMDSFLEFRNNQ